MNTPSKMWQCHEAIHRGEPCLACGAEWHKVPGHSYRELIHTSRCAFWAWMQHERTQR
jgi:hypothetical protein